MDKAKAHLDAAAEAVARGDMEEASRAIQALQPLLKMREAEQILELKERIDALKISVKKHQRESVQALNKARQKTSVARHYNRVANFE